MMSDPTFHKGQDVWYINKDGQQVPAKVGFIELIVSSLLYTAYDPLFAEVASFCVVLEEVFRVHVEMLHDSSVDTSLCIHWSDLLNGF